LPLDKKKLDALLEEIKRLDDTKITIKHSRPAQVNTNLDYETISVKKGHLLLTERKMYFLLCHYFKLTLLSINDTATALEIWIKAILPLLLQRHGIDLEEWERICDIGDNNPLLEKELDESWLDFFQHIIKKGQIDREILILINEGKKRVIKMQKESQESPSSS
jgi:hypothetical protein